MDLAKRFDYEKTVPLDLVDPATDKPVGVTFEIRSSSSPEAKKVQLEEMNRIGERRQRGKLVKAEQAIGSEVRKAASCIASWDWGDNTYDGEVPRLTMPTAMKILDEQDWIYEQVVEKAAALANFTSTSKPASAGASPKA